MDYYVYNPVVPIAEALYEAIRGAGSGIVGLSYFLRPLGIACAAGQSYFGPLARIIASLLPERAHYGYDRIRILSEKEMQDVLDQRVVRLEWHLSVLKEGASLTDTLSHEEQRRFLEMGLSRLKDERQKSGRT